MCGWEKPAPNIVCSSWRLMLADAWSDSLDNPTLRGCLSAPLCFFWCWHLSVEPLWHKLHGVSWQMLGAASSPCASPVLSASCSTSLLMEGPTACNVLCGALQEDGCFMRTAGAVRMEWLSHRCNTARQDTTGRLEHPRAVVRAELTAAGHSAMNSRRRCF